MYNITHYKATLSQGLVFICYYESFRLLYVSIPIFMTREVLSVNTHHLYQRGMISSYAGRTTSGNV